MKRHGFRNLVNVYEGNGAMQRAGLEVVKVEVAIYHESCEVLNSARHIYPFQSFDADMTQSIWVNRLQHQASVFKMKYY